MVTISRGGAGAVRMVGGGYTSGQWRGGEAGRESETGGPPFKIEPRDLFISVYANRGKQMFPPRASSAESGLY